MTKKSNKLITSKKTASAASKVLRDSKSGQLVKSAAGSARTQRPDKQRPQILIRNLDAAVLTALRQRAAKAGTSVEEEARRALASSAGLTRDAALARLDAVRERIGRVDGPSSLEDLRHDRSRDGSA